MREWIENAIEVVYHDMDSGCQTSDSWPTVLLVYMLILFWSCICMIIFAWLNVVSLIGPLPCALISVCGGLLCLICFYFTLRKMVKYIEKRRDIRWNFIYTISHIAEGENATYYPRNRWR